MREHEPRSLPRSIPGRAWCIAGILAATACARSSPPVERVVPNDNRVAAGSFQHGVLTLHLEARDGRWFPDGDVGPSIVMQMFAEAGQAPRNPGPLIRVRAGTVIHVSVRNALRDSTLVVYGLHTRPASPTDTVQVAPGTTRHLEFPAGEPGTYFYWAST